MDNNGDEIKVHDEGNGIYIFTMTASKAVVDVRFEKYNAEKNVDDTVRIYTIYRHKLR